MSKVVKRVEILYIFYSLIRGCGMNRLSKALTGIIMTLAFSDYFPN